MRRLAIVIPVMLAFAGGLVVGTRLPSAEAQRAKPMSAKACRVALTHAQDEAAGARVAQRAAEEAAAQASAELAAMRERDHQRVEALRQQIGEMAEEMK